MNATEIRAWVTLAIAAVGAVVALNSYRASQRQRRLENTFRLLSLFRESLRPGDVEQWEQVFHGASEPAAPRPGYFLLDQSGNALEQPFSDLFTEGPPDGGAVERIADALELVASEAIAGTIDLRVAYFQVGQFMTAVHAWLSAIPGTTPNRTFIQEHYPSLSELFRSRRIKAKWRYRYQVHAG